MEEFEICGWKCVLTPTFVTAAVPPFIPRSAPINCPRTKVKGENETLATYKRKANVMLEKKVNSALCQRLR
jgi:hypothetical protein